MPTIKDVARALNISITTVSRALDGYADVSSDTRELVTRTAREMGYSPNRAARQLRRQKAETVGFILPAGAERFDEPFFTEFISGLADALSEHNFDLLVANARSDEQERNFYQRWLNSRKVDGMVLNRIQQHDWRVQYLSSANFPFSALGKSQDQPAYPHISIDGAQGYKQLVQHLCQRGFSRLAFIGGPAGLVNHINGLKWYQAALKKFNLPLDASLRLQADLTSSGGYEAAKKLLGLPRPPDAILCINDETAFGALHAAHEHGLDIGRELAIAGFDGVQDSSHTEPPLTTLDIPLGELASQLAHMLLAKINGETLAAEEIIIRPTLLVRASTGGK